MTDNQKHLDRLLADLEASYRREFAQLFGAPDYDGDELIALDRRINETYMERCFLFWGKIPD